MKSSLRGMVARGPFPYDDGWGWLYRVVERAAPAGGRLRGWLCRWLYPSRIELWRRGLVYKLLGVHWFGSVIPTGGILVRRVTGARMAPYTLTGTSLGAARAFYYRTCVFEMLHMPFFLTLVVLAVMRAAEGRWDLALEDTAINVAVNLYPMMHHRRTRGRIVRLLSRWGSAGPRRLGGSGRGSSFGVCGFVHTVVVVPFLGRWSNFVIVAFACFGTLTVLSRRLARFLRQERCPTIVNILVNVGLVLGSFDLGFRVNDFL